MNLNKTQSLPSKNLQLSGEEKQIGLFSQHRAESPLLAHATSAVGACPEDLSQGTKGKNVTKACLEGQQPSPTLKQNTS